MPENVDWQEVVALSYREGVAALAVDGLQKLYEVANQSLALENPEMESLKYEWFGTLFQVETDSRLHNQRAAELAHLFANAGFKSCILKGQGTALLYSNPSLRQCGDIDIWVEGGRKRVLEFLRNRFKVGTAVIHHAHVDIFPDVAVEVHYLPAWLYNPFVNRRLQQYFDSEADAQFGNMTSSGFAAPRPKFNIVFNAVHIYKHYFQNELSLKQLVDYYYILKNSAATDRQDAFGVLKLVGLGPFTAWLMGKMDCELSLSPELALCPASISDTCHRPFGELLCIFPWKVWHWFAMKRF